MSAITATFTNSNAVRDVAGNAESWYAVQTRARHERVVVQRFKEKGLPTFLPVYNEMRRWSDRWKSVELPLFKLLCVRENNGDERRPVESA